MSGLSRRNFLRGAAASAAAASALPRGVQAAMSIGPAGGSLSAVKHVVIFTQENRSFDHYFGALEGVRGFADPTALTLRGGASVFAQPGWTGPRTPFHLDTSTTSAQTLTDLDHSWIGQHAAWSGGHYDHWVPSKTAWTMGYYNRNDIPLHYALADAFTICDHYFSSVIGPTNPNRLYLMTGMIDPRATGGGPAFNNFSSNFSWTTYPERLQAAGVSWKVYQNTADNYDDNPLAWFKQFRAAAPGTELHDRALSSVPATSGDTVTDVVNAIRNDVLNGTLPQVSWIVAPQESSEHPVDTPAAGADIIARVLEALTADPAVWASTVLLLNYDENDGFFDHLAPPVAPPGTPDEFVGGQPIGLGVRVPMIVMSPWSRGGNVCSQVFDHTSTLRFLETWTGVQEPNISAWRRKICGDLTSTLNFTSMTLSVPALPDTGALLAKAKQQVATLPAPTIPNTAVMPVPESLKNRPARPLPYQLNAGATLDLAAGLLRVTMANAGNAAASLAMHANDFRIDGPWVYDANAGATVKDTFTPSLGKFDLSLYGPNGFLRRFAGDTGGVGAGAEANVSYNLLAAGGATVDVRLSNATRRIVTFNLHCNAYRTDAPRAIQLLPMGSQVVSFEVENSTGGWYDFSVTVTGDATFHRRMAGHVETGRASVTGATPTPKVPGMLASPLTQVRKGLFVVFDFQAPTFKLNGGNAVVLLKAGQTPGNASPVQKLGAGTAHGRVVFTTIAMSTGNYAAWLVGPDGRSVLADPVAFTVLPTIG